MEKSFIDLQAGDKLIAIKLDFFPAITLIYWRMGDEIHKRSQLNSSMNKEDFIRWIEGFKFYNFIGQKIKEIKIDSPYIVYVFENGAKLKSPIGSEVQTLE
ncbi:MAG: hypothetical protein KME29_15470 [Calothrix sp. FI2-JRJ7]|jgi:hypothetical protein|nr:hypothetical protein [Calothrix sp. FI2-JRJ7]